MKLGITVEKLTAALRALLVGTVLVASIACGDEPESGADTRDLTRGLLSAAGGGAGGGPSGSPSPLRQVSIDDLGFNRGSSEAPIRVIEMSDYGCGYCRQFHMETFPSLKEEFIDGGIVEWKFVPYVTGMFDNSRAALRAAECSLEQSPELFERINERLWQEQSAWKGSSDAAGLVRSWADEAGVDMDEFDACHTTGRRADRITAGAALAQEIGVRGTPTFLVVGYGPLQGALPLDTFQRVLRSVQEQVEGR